ncbi:collagen alpha-1(I) chain-like [Eschrichtius robustus]|uniref:collagen alpha-1(I) chain-like n=1 Tax=Eschrichtius robustus TaxID=9764 RepID=UPI0035C05010
MNRPARCSEEGQEPSPGNMALRLGSARTDPKGGSHCQIPGCRTLRARDGGWSPVVLGSAGSSQQIQLRAGGSRGRASTAQLSTQVQMDPERPHISSLQAGIRGLLAQSEGPRERGAQRARGPESEGPRETSSLRGPEPPVGSVPPGPRGREEEHATDQMASEIKPRRSPGESEAAAVAMAGWAGALCLLAATRAQPTNVNTGSGEGGPQQSPSGETPSPGRPAPMATRTELGGAGGRRLRHGDDSPATSGEALPPQTQSRDSRAGAQDMLVLGWFQPHPAPETKASLGPVPHSGDNEAASLILVSAPPGPCHPNKHRNPTEGARQGAPEEGEGAPRTSTQRAPGEVDSGGAPLQTWLRDARARSPQGRVWAFGPTRRDLGGPLPQGGALGKVSGDTPPEPQTHPGKAAHCPARGPCDNIDPNPTHQATLSREGERHRPASMATPAPGAQAGIRDAGEAAGKGPRASWEGCVSPGPPSQLFTTAVTRRRETSDAGGLQAVRSCVTELGAGVGLTHISDNSTVAAAHGPASSPACPAKHHPIWEKVFTGRLCERAAWAEGPPATAGTPEPSVYSRRGFSAHTSPCRPCPVPRSPGSDGGRHNKAAEGPDGTAGAPRGPEHQSPPAPAAPEPGCGSAEAAREQNPLSEGPLSCHLCSGAAGLPAWLLAPPPTPQLHRQGHLYANPTDTGGGRAEEPSVHKVSGRRAASGEPWRPGVTSTCSERPKAPPQKG